MRWVIFIATLVFGPVLAGVASADMVQPEWQQTVTVQPSAVSSTPSQESLRWIGSNEAGNYGGRPDLFGLPSGALSERVAGTPEPSETQPVMFVLADDRDSLTFCLYGLIGLAFCKSASSLKKASLYHLPEWYHDGGPFRIGHSLAVSPTCICEAETCLIQPEPPVDEPLIDYRFGTVVLCWRTSQFTPAVLAARAPPRPSW